MNVQTRTAVSALFDEDVIGLDGSTFTLRQLSVFEPLPATVTYDRVQRVATLSPLVPLLENTTYVVTVSSDITDTNGHPFVGWSWEFTTVKDMNVPRVVLATPGNGETGVAVNAQISVVLSERVINLVPSSFYVAGPSGVLNADTNYLSATAARMSAPLDPYTTYTVTLTSAIRSRGTRSTAHQSAGRSRRAPTPFRRRSRRVTPRSVSRRRCPPVTSRSGSASPSSKPERA